jgi:hypothetical protein
MITRRYIIQLYYAIEEREDAQDPEQGLYNRQSMDSERLKHCNGYYRRVLVAEGDWGISDATTWIEKEIDR